MEALNITGDEAGLIVAGIALVGFLVRGLKTDALASFLAFLGLPQIPKRALPWSSFVLGIVFAVLTKRHAGATWGAALLNGLVEGVLVGGGASYVHDLGKALPGLGKALAFVLVVSTASSACVPVKSPRADVRSVVVTVAEGVKVADEACASVARGKQDRNLAIACADGVNEAREALIVAEDGVDAWDEASAGRVTCAVKRALEGLGKIADRIEKAGGRIPPAVVDARSVASHLTVLCRG